MPPKAGTPPPRGGMRPGAGIREDGSEVPSSVFKSYGETALWVAACPEEDLVATNCVYISRDSLQVHHASLLSSTLLVSRVPSQLPCADFISAGKQMGLPRETVHEAAASTSSLVAR